MIIERFEPIALHVERVGPFEMEYKLDFMKSFDDEDHRPSRLFLLASQNGCGKTTLLEAFALAMSILGKKRYPLPLTEDILWRKGTIQLDIRIIAILSDKQRVDKIISLSVGRKMYEYLPAELEKLNAPNDQEFILFSPALDDIRQEGSFGAQFCDSIKLSEKQTFPGLFSENPTFPTALYFSCERGVVRPPSDEIMIARPDNLDYQPCHIIGREEGNWRNSIDNLFCWFSWRSGDEEKTAYDLVNNLVFIEPDKELLLRHRDPPYPEIKTSGQFHRLDRLSSGERTRLQIILRTASLMTAHTMLLIDELELHLHPVWQHRLLDSLIELVRRYPGLHIYYTTHSKELFERGLSISYEKDESIMASHKILS